jgi:hypothetical protein
MDILQGWQSWTWNFLQPKQRILTEEEKENGIQFCWNNRQFD